MARRRQYGSGSIRLRGKTFWLRYYDEKGERIEESAETDVREDAERLLKIKIGQVAAGTGRAIPPAKATLSDCFVLIVEDYKLHERRSLPEVEKRIEVHLKPTLGWIVAADFTTRHAEQYIRDRMKAGAANATVNREIAVVRRALNLSRREAPPWIPFVPYLPILSEDNVRTGFLTPEEYGRMREALPQHLKPLLCTAYYSGLRRGTLLSLKLDQVDLEAGVICVSKKQTKNRRGQSIPILAGEMRAWIEMAVSTNKAYLFENDGERIRSFKTAWATARTIANLPHLNFHDLRRTAVRDWLAAGVQEEIAMQISGHKTRSMLQRYNIITERDVLNAARKREESLPKNAAAEKLGTNQGQALKSKPS
ncbi:MAG: site-specific integrase [Bryobacterales bacterium]|nr:site-specific integrase [Bryobacterales bacterium]